MIKTGHEKEITKKSYQKIPKQLNAITCKGLGSDFRIYILKS